MEEMFDIEKFNVISDEENYYFFRSLEPGDIKDLEEGNIKDENGKYIRLRTDRERWEGTHSIKPRWNAESTVTLEEMYNHIKMHYSLETNCISLSSNANVARTYGETFSDKYVMIKVPKKEMGQRVYNAGQYMLSEIARKVQERIAQGNIPEEVLEDLKKIDEATKPEDLKEIIKVKYTAPKGIDTSKSGMKKGIVYKAPLSRISSFQALNDEQTLEKNKIVAKLTILEQKGLMGPAVPRIKTNSELIKTLGSAFASGEQIYYGDIEGNRVTDISKEFLDMFALIQQAENQDKQIVNELKTELVKYITKGGKLEIPEESLLRDEGTPITDISIEEMYELTAGKVEYGQANSIVKNMYYLSKGQANARILAGMIREITGNNPKYEEIIKYIENNGFEIEPKITARKSNKGYRISESVNLDLKPNEIGLVDSIRNLTTEEQMQIIQDRGLSNVRDIMNTSFAQMQTAHQISKEDYFASAIVDTYDWDKINVEELSITERNELIQKLKQSNCVSIYEKLKEAGIENKDIPTAVINMASKGRLNEILQTENYVEQIQENIGEITQNLSIEQIERYLGYYDVKGTGIELRDYQQVAIDNTNEVFKDKRFASVILPTGGGKTYVALTEMLQYGKTQEEIEIENNQLELERIPYPRNDKKMLYLAPSNEILEQTKDRIIENIHGKIGTSGKSKDKIIAEVFPNLQFATYQSLISKAGKEKLKTQYDFMIFDELHRTGAEKWEKSLDKLIENQLETTKVLGITATPTRDADSRNMADEIAKKLGYTDEEIQANKHIAKQIELKEAIQLGMVVNPKIVSCEYTVLTDGTMENLKEEIDEIADEDEKKKKLEKYDKLRKNLKNATGISEIIQQNVKKGGKYVIFIPVGQNSYGDEIEDEEGNSAENAKNAVDKIKEYERKMREYLKDSGIDAEYYSMLGTYTDKGNANQLESFESEDENKTKFMIVMNKANEGLHIKGVDGMIWFRALDEDSKILYLQQLGRVITSRDPNNPIEDEKRPVVIDLANNTQRVNIDKELKNNNRKNDLELLTIVVDWVKSHGGNLPQVTSTSDQEKRYSATLYRIQQKYIKYRNVVEDGEITEEDRKNIEAIITKGEEIELWDRELEKITKEESDKILDVDSFEVKGNLHDLYELEKEVEGLPKRNTIDEFIEKMEKLQGIGVDVSKIASEDTILKLAQKTFKNQDEEELIEKIKGEGLEPGDNIGSKLSTMRKSYRQAKEGKKPGIIPPTEEQVKRMQEMGIMLKKIDTIDEFIEKMEKLQGIGVDVSKITSTDTILTLAQKTFENQDEEESIEMIKGEGLEAEDKIGNKLRVMRADYRKAKKGKKPGQTPPTEEQVKRMQEMKIMVELEKIDTIEEFIEKMEKLQGIGVDVSKITSTDTILTLAQKTFENQDEEELIEKIKGEGLEPGDKIGSKLNNMRTDYIKAKKGEKSKGSSPTEEQVKRMQEMGIIVELEKIDIIEEFVEKMEKLQCIGIDVSKIVEKDTILTLVKKTFENQNEEELIEKLNGEGLDPEDNIGNKLGKMRRSYSQDKEGKKTEVTPPTDKQVKRMQKIGIMVELEKIDTIDEFIEKMEKLRGIGVDVSKITRSDTILMLAQKTFENQDEEELIEMIKGEGLEPGEKIGNKLNNMRISYRQAKKGEKSKGIPPTDEQVNRMQEMGIVVELEKIDTIEEFIEKMEKLQGIGVDVSKIASEDTILKLVQKTFVNQDEEKLIEKIKGEGLEPGDKIGKKLSTMRASYSRAKEGKKSEWTPPTDEQVKRMQEIGIRVEQLEKIDTIEEFLEKMEKLQGIGVDVSKIASEDTILKLAQKTFVNQNEEKLIEKIKGEGLEPGDKIGNKLSNMRASYSRAKEGKKLTYTPPTDEQVNRMQEIGIRVEQLEKIDTIDEFIKKIEKLQGIGVDVSKIVLKDTILTLAQKTFVNQDEEKLIEKIKGEGLEPGDKIGNKLSTMRASYSKAKERKKPGMIPPTEEQVKRMQGIGIILEKQKITGQYIGRVSITTVQKCDEVQRDLNRLVQEQQTKEGGQH